MRFFIPSLNQAFLACSFANGKTLRWPSLLLLGMLLGSPVVRAQQAEAPPASDSQTLQLLLERVAELEAKVKRIDQLEARIKQLESGKQLAPAAAVDPASAPAPAPAPAQANTSSGTEAAQQEMPAMQERMDLSKTH